ncbi:DUF2125 domain-containing protein [Marivivens donghaensis]|jgi:hypothetical protein|uniref:DUF2125 domain-containing protein n=1 Tax=Marivivens donghaensis TaxID=1699413 RepID=UPI003F69ED25
MRIKGWAITGAMVFGLYWAAGSFGLQSLVQSAIQADTSSKAQDVALQLSPLRFSTRVDGYENQIDDLTTFVAASAEVSIPTYAPNRARIEMLGPVQIVGPAWTIKVSADDLSIGGSVQITRNGDLGRFDLSGLNVVIVTPDTEAETIEMHLSPSGADVYDLDLSLTNFTLPTKLTDIILATNGFGSFDPTHQLPETVSAFSINGAVKFDPAPALFGNTDPLIAGVDFAPLTLTWGEIDLTIDGLIDILPDGTPSGQLDVTLKGWETVLRMLAANGAIKPANLMGYQAMASGLASDDGSITLPLIFADGQMRLAAFTLGPAPKLR